jgi:hypothetical protein
VLAHVDNPQVTYWHSAAFTWDGKYVLWSDESETGSCRNPHVDTDGRLWIYKRGSWAKPLSSFTVPRAVEGDCSVHMYQFVPTRRAYLLVGAWYEAGISAIDYTTPTKPREVAHYDPPPEHIPNYWSAYWYDGHVYGNDILRGLDVLDLSGVPGAITLGHMNPQTQEILLR